jgi:hypothetical protein
MSTGRRPHVSDSAPAAGTPTSCDTENDAKSSPIVSGEAPKRLRVERQQRDDDPEPDQVDEDRQENDEERPAHFFSVMPLMITGSSGTSSMPSFTPGFDGADAIHDVMPSITRPKTA